ncbi:MAG TPA: RloB domain-containing protein [Saprospiraceae bacterium]|nr:RloB domain-containing protein [Saprospiraceae bacterium]
MMKKHEVRPRIDIKPELPKKKKLADQFKSVLQNGAIYDEVIWIVDFDTILKEHSEAIKGSQSPLELFATYMKKVKKHKNITILVNTPCLEYWVLLHYADSDRYFSKCEHAEVQLKRNHLPNYEKSEKYFKKRDDDIYLKLKPYQVTAKLNAKRLGDFDLSQPKTAKSEIYKVLELFGISS